jgi:hypothetical protein
MVSLPYSRLFKLFSVVRSRVYIKEKFGLVDFWVQGDYRP